MAGDDDDNEDLDLDGGLVAALTRTIEGKSDGLDESDEDDAFGFNGKPDKDAFTDTLQGPSRRINEEDVKLAEDEEGDEDDQPEPPKPNAKAEPKVDDNPDNGKFDLFNHVKSKHGVDLSGKYKSPEDAIDGLVNAQRRLGERDEYAHWGQQLATNPEQMYKLLGEQLHKNDEHRDPRENPKAPVGEPNNAPALEWDDAWLDELDENGKPKPDADRKVLAKIRRWNEQSAVAGRNIVKTFGPDPEAAIARIVEKRVVEALKAAPLPDVKKLEAKIAERDERDAQVKERETLISEGESLLAGVSSWAFVEGDRSKGATPAGKVLQKYLVIASEKDARGQAKFQTMTQQMEWSIAKAITEMQQNPAQFTGGNGNPKPNTKPDDPRLNRDPGTKRRQRDEDDVPDSVAASGNLAQFLSHKFGGA